MGVGIVFPGQGAQAADMGAPWRAHPAWDAVVGRAEAVVGAPLEHLLVGPPAERTREAQLSVLLTSLMAWEAVRDEVGAVTCFAGHSLGQVTALIAAGALDFEDGVRFALQRADATQAAADRRPGRMAALLGADDAQVEAACAAAPDACWPANDNAPGQVVIAGTPEGLAAAVDAARAAGVRKIMALNVGGAFHTPLMEEARQALAPVLAELSLAAGSAPVVSNGDGMPYADGEGWRSRLADHLVQPVRWRACLETIAGLGVSSLIEVGPGAALAGMAKRTVPHVPVRNVSTPADAGVTVEV